MASFSSATSSVLLGIIAPNSQFVSTTLLCATSALGLIAALVIHTLLDARVTEAFDGRVRSYYDYHVQAGSPQGAPATVTVPQDCDNLPAAVAKVQAGGRIVVRPGTYWGPVLINKPVEIALGRLTMEDCRATGARLSSVGVHGHMAEAVLRRCVLRAGAQAGVFAYEGARAMLEDCEVAQHHKSGVTAQEGSALTVRRCRIHDSGEFGVALFSGAGAEVDDCDIEGAGMSAVLVENAGTTATVRASRLHAATQCGLPVIAAEATLDNCDVYANGLAGLEVRDAGSAHACGSRFYDGKHHGAYAHTGRRCSRIARFAAAAGPA